MSEQPQHHDLEKTQALVDQARMEARIRVAEIENRLAKACSATS